jgi:hypothetical protein
MRSIQFGVWRICHGDRGREVPSPASKKWPAPYNNMGTQMTRRKCLRRACCLKGARAAGAAVVLVMVVVVAGGSDAKTLRRLLFPALAARLEEDTTCQPTSYRSCYPNFRNDDQGEEREYSLLPPGSGHWRCGEAGHRRCSWPTGARP